MDLECLQHHMKGQKVLVNGTLYEVGTDCIVHDVKAEDAAEMLKSRVCWRHVAPAKTHAVKTPVAAPVVAPVPTPVPAPAEPEAPAKTPEVIPVAEWPDPEEKMDLGYLQKMAAAYDVKYDAKTPKKTLVKRIRDAMYD